MATLNPAQKEAVEYTGGPLLIVAGAGTGKTTVITQKIVHLIKKGLAKPEEILALTFTDKAAGEMVERVDELLDLGYLDMQVSTFHAFCQRILESRGLEIGIPNHFKLLTETDAWLLVRDNFDKFELDYYRPLGNPTRHIHELIKHFQKCKDELISPQEYLNYVEHVQLNKGDANTDERNRLTEIANAYHLYNQILLNHNALDFADLIYYTYQLLYKRPTILQSLSARFKYILVDEFQDVNWSQYQLVKKLAANHGQLTVVGDDDQSIYAFRGASVSNILRFKEDYPTAKEIVLNDNYRSRQEILDIAYKSIQNNNPDRLEEKLKINKRLQAKVNLFQTGSGQASLQSKIIHLCHTRAEEEVDAVVEEIIKLKKEDSSAVWDDFAILVRANSQAEPFLQRLEAVGVPYEFIASTGLYRQPIVLDCLNYFKLLDNYHESSAVYRLLHLPFFKFSEYDAQKFTGLAKKKGVPYYEALKRAGEFGLSKDGVNVCDTLLSLIHAGLRRARVEKSTTVLYEFLERSGYLAYLTHEADQENGKVNRQIYQLQQFFNYLRSYEQAAPDARVHNFMEHWQYARDAGDEGKLYQPADTPDSVNIMTVHGAKGLEFKYVFIVNLVEDRFPTRSRGEAIEIPEELIKEQLPEGDAHYQEERRLFYVAMTRAKARLYFTSAHHYGGVQKKRLSRFLNELDFGQNNSVEIESSSKDYRSYFTPNESGRVAGSGLGADLTTTMIQYDIPKTFSYSQIRSYQTCPYQYKLAHILKIPTKGSASFSFGNTMHTTLQRFYERVQELNRSEQGSLFNLPPDRLANAKVKVPALEELLHLYEVNWIEDWYQDKKQKTDYQQKGREILKAFYASHESRWSVPLALESNFKIKVGEYLITGKIDRVDQLPDGTLEIIDYKTGQSKAKVTGDEKDQLLIYQIAAETLPEYRHVGRISRLTFYYLNDNIKTSFVGQDKNLEKLRDKITATANRIHQRDFAATPNKIICGRCDFRDICEYRA